VVPVHFLGEAVEQVATPPTSGRDEGALTRAILLIGIQVGASHEKTV
jgi:hypothetical protein